MWFTLNVEIFVENLKAILDKRGISYSGAGRESEAGQEFIRSMERQKSAPSYIKVQQMAKYLGMTTSELLGESESGPTTVTDDEAALDEELISRLCQLTAEELEKADAFVQGLLAAR